MEHLQYPYRPTYSHDYRKEAENDVNQRRATRHENREDIQDR